MLAFLPRVVCIFKIMKMMLVTVGIDTAFLCFAGLLCGVQPLQDTKDPQGETKKCPSYYFPFTHNDLTWFSQERLAQQFPLNFCPGTLSLSCTHPRHKNETKYLHRRMSRAQHRLTRPHNAAGTPSYTKVGCSCSNQAAWGVILQHSDSHLGPALQQQSTSSWSGDSSSRPARATWLALAASAGSMVMSEVAKDPPSPFVTVQSAYDGNTFPAVPPPALEQHRNGGGDVAPAGSRSSSWTQPGSNSGHSFGGPGSARMHLQSIVSQQSLNFNTPPDSPLEVEHALNSIAASSGAAGNGAAHGSSPGAAAAAGHADLAAVLASAQQQQQLLRDTPAAPPGDSSKHHKVLRLLGGSWLRQTQSVPHTCTLPHKGHQHPSTQQQDAAAMLQQQQELSFKHIHSVLDKQDVAQDDLLQSQLQPLGGSRKLKTRVHKLLAWASGRVPSLGSSTAASPQVHTAPLGGCGSLTFVPGASSHHHHQQHQQQQQQQQGVPIPWQHQVFSNDLTVQPSVQPSVQRISSTGERAGRGVCAANAWRHPATDQRNQQASLHFGQAATCLHILPRPNPATSLAHALLLFLVCRRDPCPTEVAEVLPSQQPIQLRLPSVGRALQLDRQRRRLCAQPRLRDHLQQRWLQPELQPDDHAKPRQGAGCRSSSGGGGSGGGRLGRRRQRQWHQRERLCAAASSSC